MDDLIGPIQQPCLVKIDVQGYEDKLIRGGRQTLGRASACIVEVDVDNMYEGQAHVMTVFGALDDCGLCYSREPRTGVRS